VSGQEKYYAVGIMMLQEYEDNSMVGARLVQDIQMRWMLATQALDVPVQISDFRAGPIATFERVEECPQQQQAKSVRIRPGREDPRAHIRRFQIRILQDEIRTCGRDRMHTMNCRAEVQTAVKFLPCMQTFEYCSYASIIVTLPPTLGWP